MKKDKNHYDDTEKNIQICLNCTRKTCPGECSLVAEKPIKPKKSRLDEKDIGLKLVSMGLSDEKIAMYMRMNASAVRRWRMVNGIPTVTSMRKKENGK